MFKRVARRVKKKEEEEALGIDEDMKEVLGMHDTDSEESDSDSGSGSGSGSDSGSEEEEEGKLHALVLMTRESLIMADRAWLGCRRHLGARGCGCL
jgi:hypothetical protein